jgi:hypothetical protein
VKKALEERGARAREQAPRADVAALLAVRRCRRADDLDAVVFEDAPDGDEALDAVHGDG